MNYEQLPDIWIPLSVLWDEIEGMISPSMNEKIA